MLLLSVTETKKKAFNFPQNIMLNSQMNDIEYAINPSGFETARRKEEMLLFRRGNSYYFMCLFRHYNSLKVTL